MESLQGQGCACESCRRRHLCTGGVPPTFVHASERRTKEAVVGRLHVARISV